jgi:tRNA(Leu) C34 or U34 (ribose-2'-O)-methylase TrmL
MQGHRILAITTKGTGSYAEMSYQKGDVLLFGSETAGLPPDIQQNIPAKHQLRIPMQPFSSKLNPSGSIKCRWQPLLAISRMMFPVFCGILGSKRAMLNIEIGDL